MGLTARSCRVIVLYVHHHAGLDVQRRNACDNEAGKEVLGNEEWLDGRAGGGDGMIEVLNK